MEDLAASSWEWKPRGVGDWLDGVFQVYRGGLRPLLALSVSIMLPLGLAGGLLAYSVTETFMSRILPLVEHSDPEVLGLTILSLLGGRVPGYFGLLLLSYLAGIYLSVGGTWLVHKHLHGEPQKLAAIFRGSWRFFWRALGASLMRGLVYLGLWASLIGITVVLAIFTHQVWMTVVAWLIGAAAAVFIAIRWSLADQAIVVEGLGVFASLGRSFRLTAGRFWATFGRLLLYGLIVTAISAAMTTATSLLNTLVIAIHSTALIVALQGLQSLINALLRPLGWIAVTLIYFDLRIRKEGYDLEQKAKSLQQDTVAPEVAAP